MVTEILVVSLLLGLVSGLLAGLFGIGGGVLIVPVLALAFSHARFPDAVQLLMAVATSLATIMLASLSSVIAHHRLRAVVWAKVKRLAPGIMLGAGLGAVVAQAIPAELLRYLLAAFLFYVGCQMALLKAPALGDREQRAWQDFGVSLLIGLLSALVGIGGGTLTVPYLLRGGMPIHKAVAVSSACGWPIAAAGTLSYALLGWSAAGLPEWSLGYVYLPAFWGVSLSSIVTAPLGAKLAHRLPAKQLKRYFSLLLLVMAVKLAWR